MDVTINTLSGVQQEAEIQVSHDELQPVFTRAYEKFRKKVEIRGFRKGKAPLDMVKKMYGEAIEHESLDTAADEFYKQAMQERNIRPVGQPTLVDMDFKRGQAFSFKIQYEVRPSIDLQNYKGLQVERPVHTITDKDVEAEIEHLRRANSTTSEVQSVTNEDHIVTADVQEMDDAGTPLVGRKSGNVRFLLSDTSLADDIKRALRNAEIGGTYRVTMETKEDDKTRQLPLALTVSKIEKVDLPLFDDAFVKTLTKEKVQTAEEFTRSIREDLQNYWKQQADRKLADALANEVVRLHEFDVPESMVTMFLDAFLDDIRNRSRDRSLPKGFDEQRFRTESRAHAIWQAKWMLLKETIAEKEAIMVGEDELDQLAATEAARMGVDKQRLLDYYKSSGSAHDRLITDKVMELLKKSAKVKDVQEQPEQLAR